MQFDVLDLVLSTFTYNILNESNCIKIRTITSSDGSIGQSVQLVDSIGQSVGLSVGQSINQSVELVTGQSLFLHRKHFMYSYANEPNYSPNMQIRYYLVRLFTWNIYNIALWYYYDLGWEGCVHKGITI